MGKLEQEAGVTWRLFEGGYDRWWSDDGTWQVIWELLNVRDMVWWPASVWLKV